MRGFCQVLIAAGLTMGVALTGGGAQAAKFKVLHSFCEGPHRPCGGGSNPQAALVMDATGNLYGTAVGGGNGFGTVFEMERKADGKFNFKPLYRFCHGSCEDGAQPFGALILDTQGNLYGTTSRGGNNNNGVVFELSPKAGKRTWVEKVLYMFCLQSGCHDGSGPVGGLTYAGASSSAQYDGTSPLYGTTAGGGAMNGGAVFQLTNTSGAWSESVLYDFCSEGGSECTDGAGPLAVTLDPAGHLFGMTEIGGGNDSKLDGAGVIFELSPNGNGSWNETTLYRFCSLRNCADGARPWRGDLAIDADGALYGTTLFGGRKCAAFADGCGVIFKLVPNGAASEETVLYEFCRRNDCEDGSLPKAGLTLGELGTLSGTTSAGGGNDSDQFSKGAGTIFELSGSSSLHVLHRFCSLAACSDGAAPDAKPILTSGTVYGTTDLGGAFGDTSSGGTIFSVEAGTKLSPSKTQ